MLLEFGLPQATWVLAQRIVQMLGSSEIVVVGEKVLIMVTMLELIAVG